MAKVKQINDMWIWEHNAGEYYTYICPICGRELVRYNQAQLEAYIPEHIRKCKEEEKRQRQHLAQLKAKLGEIPLFIPEEDFEEEEYTGEWWNG